MRGLNHLRYTLGVPARNEAEQRQLPIAEELPDIALTLSRIVAGKPASRRPAPRRQQSLGPSALRVRFGRGPGGGWTRRVTARLRYLPLNQRQVTRQQ